MAQVVEHVLGKDEVTGSNPVISSTDPVHFVNGIYSYLPLLPKFLTGIKELQKTPVRCPAAAEFVFSAALRNPKRKIRIKTSVSPAQFISINKFSIPKNRQPL